MSWGGLDNLNSRAIAQAEEVLRTQFYQISRRRWPEVHPSTPVGSTARGWCGEDVVGGPLFRSTSQHHRRVVGLTW